MLGGSTSREALFGMGCGVLYGLTSPLIGHPFDTIKTKMQAQVFLPFYFSITCMLKCAKHSFVWKKKGGLQKGGNVSSGEICGQE